MSVLLENFDLTECTAADCRELSVEEFKKEYPDALDALSKRIKNQIQRGHFGIVLNSKELEEIFPCAENHYDNAIIESLLFYLKTKDFSYTIDSFKNTIYITWGR